MTKHQLLQRSEQLPGGVPSTTGSRRAYLSLGSNQGDPLEQIRRALRQLTAAGIEVVQLSSLYRTEPVDYKLQPWFVNCVAEIRTRMMPRQLLNTLQRIERTMGRRRTFAKGPRVIDIDILLFEDVILRSPGLAIPHPRLPERKFVLVPLCEIAARLRHPVTQRTAAELLERTSDTGKVVRLKANGA